MSEEIRIELQGQFGYQYVRIQQSQDLGVGSYGSVCRATLDELPCAAKLLHATFFGTHDPGAVNFTARFEQECHFLSNLRHPCIVQFLGLVREPRNLRPILLMELMDESLTKFLERTAAPLPYHVQVNLIHDTALALAYLHSNRIIHRDLSSNNVLLLAGSRAKVTDFGMSRMVDVNPRTTPFTQCPGTPAFMAPEALLATPHYSDKLDVFSAGVLAIQVMTHRFPNPCESKREIDYPASPTGVIEVPVPERERRKDDLDRIASTHPLLPIAVRCIRDRERERPSAAQMCESLATLKETPAYTESVQERPGNAACLQQTRASLEEKERENRDLRQQLVQNEQELQDTVQELAEKEDSIQAKDQALRANEQEMRAKNQQLQDKVKEVADLRREVANLKQHLARIQRRNSPEVKRDVSELQRQQSKENETTEVEFDNYGT